MSNLINDLYQTFSQAPLTAEQVDLYVNLDPVRGDGEVVRRLAGKIRLSDAATCQVLAGHRGSGKSTELQQLATLLLETPPRYFVLLCKADADIDRNDIDFPDVLVAIVRQLASALKQQGIELKPGYFKDRWLQLKELLGSPVSFDSLDLEAGLLTIAGAIKSSPNARRDIRRILEPDANNWLHAANDVIGQAIIALHRKHNFKGLVILVDDLDKMVIRPHEHAGCLTSEYLFIHRAAQLTAFQCHVVYTLPLSLAYSHHEAAIKASYGGHVPVVPMTKIRTRPPDSQPHEPGLKLLRQLVEARLTRCETKIDQVFESEAVLERLLLLSGGQPTELMGLVREALVFSGLPIRRAALDRAEREGRREYARQIRAEHRAILDEVAATGGVTRTSENDARFRDLLDSRAVLQYVNDAEWYGLNPMVGDSVTRSTRR